MNLDSYIRSVTESNAKLAASRAAAVSKEADGSDNESMCSILSSVSTISAASTKSSSKRNDYALKLSIEDVGMQDLNDFLCPISCRFGRKCCRRVTIGAVCDQRSNYWGIDGSVTSTKQRGEKTFAFLLDAKTKTASLPNYNHNNKDIVFEFALDNDRNVNGTTNPKTIICEGMFCLAETYS